MIVAGFEKGNGNELDFTIKLDVKAIRKAVTASSL